MIKTIARVACLFALATGVAAEAAPLSAHGAASPTPSSVTIRALGLNFSGTVTSSRPVCEGDRKVVVFKVVGAKGGSDDIRFTSGTTRFRRGVGVWRTVNTGGEGRFYAKARKTIRILPGRIDGALFDVPTHIRCSADVSPVITVVRAD